MTSFTPARTFAADKAWPGVPEQIAAPFRGVVEVVVAEGHRVAVGDPVATISGTERTAVLTAPLGGVVQRVAVPGGVCVDFGDLLLMLRRSQDHTPTDEDCRLTGAGDNQERG